MNVFIRQLTGIRFVAAAWVLLYHLQGPLNTIGLLAIPGLGDVLRVGRLGVDLFFALSGFILTHTYLRRMGPALKARRAVDFWWLRLARIYPVHLTMILVAGVAVVAQAKVTGEQLNRDWLNPFDLLKHLFLVQEWGANPDRGWNFVSWSLSMEWLAYLLFPLLVLLFWTLYRKVSTALLALLWIVALSPVLVYALGTSDSYYTNNWGSTYRILTEFTAGAITYLFVTRLMDASEQEPATARIERLATTLSVVLPVLVIAGAIVLGNMPAAQPPHPAVVDADAEPIPPYYHLLLVPLLIAWIGALALSRRGLARFLSTRTLVLGGFISYSLYMTHLVWFGLWRAGMKAVGISGGALYAVGVVALVAGALFIAWLMWKFVEEPAREGMRGWIGARRRPTEEAGESAALSRADADSAEPVDVPRAPGDPTS